MIESEFVIKIKIRIPITENSIGYLCVGGAPNANETLKQASVIPVFLWKFNVPQLS